MAYQGSLPVIIFGDHTRNIKYVDFNFAQGADGVKVLKSKPFFHPKAFYYALKNLNIPNLGYRRHFPLFPKFMLPLPPFNEQKRIIAEVEKMYAKLDEAREKIESVVASFETRKAAILHAAFTGKLTAKWREERGILKSTWNLVSACNIFSYVTSGSRGWAKYYATAGAIFLRMGNLSHGTINIDLSDIQHVNLPDKAEGQRSLIQKNDILISITADVGMVGLVKKSIGEAYINQHVALARPISDKTIFPEFIAWYLVSDIGQNQLRKKQRGATKVGLGLNDIRALELDLPSLAEQREIVRLLDDLLAKEQAAKEKAEAVLGQIDTLKKSILARAFRGEL